MVDENVPQTQIPRPQGIHSRVAKWYGVRTMPRLPGAAVPPARIEVNS